MRTDVVGSPSARGDTGSGLAGVLNPAATVRPEDVVTAGTPGAALTAARNEFESFQVVTRPGTDANEAASVRLSSPLRGRGGRIPAGNVTIYRQHPFTVTRPSDAEGEAGLWYDALIPSRDTLLHQHRKAFPYDLPAGQNMAVWVDVQVPRTTRPGTYEGRLTVTVAGDEQDVPVRLTVLDLTLPSTPTLTSSFQMLWNGGCLAVPGQCVTEADSWRENALYTRLALNNRISISNAARQPLDGEPGNATHELFRKYLLPLIKGTDRDTLLPGAKVSTVAAWGAGENSESVLAAWRKEPQAQGFGRRMFVHACDEPNDHAEVWEVCRARSARARADRPGVPVMATTSLPSARSHEFVSGVDTLTVLVSQMHDREGGRPQFLGDQRPAYDDWLATPKQPRNTLWLYTSCESHGCGEDSAYHVGWPGYVIDQPATEARAMGWLAYRYRADGEFYYQTMESLSTAWTDQWKYSGNGDGNLFYPWTADLVGGTDPVPVESLRLKRIRDGYEDYEYLAHLREQGRGDLADATAAALYPSMYQAGPSDTALIDARARLVRAVAGPDRS